MNLPIACTLSDAERTSDSASLLSGLVCDAVDLEPLDTGYRARFAGAPGRVARIAAVIERERGCCKFLTFAVHAKAADGDIELVISGPEGTRPFLDHLLDVRA